jgi:hypothetical protein
MVSNGTPDLYRTQPMKRLPTKAQVRSELEQQIEHYLKDGGEVKTIPRGLSGHTDNRNVFGKLGENQPRQERTPLDDVVKELEARKHPKSHHNTLRRPRKKLITDDFGEPLRWVWTED